MAKVGFEVGLSEPIGLGLIAHLAQMNAVGAGPSIGHPPTNGTIATHQLHEIKNGSVVAGGQSVHCAADLQSVRIIGFFVERVVVGKPEEFRPRINPSYRGNEAVVAKLKG